MNDFLTILGFVIIVSALMAGCFALGRWDRRQTYTPGPPAPDPFLAAALAEPCSEVDCPPLEDYTISESVRLVPRNAPPSPLTFNIKLPKGHDPNAASRMVSWMLARQMGTPPNRWPPPGKLPNGQWYMTWAGEQGYWLDLLGKPGPRKPGMTCATCLDHPELPHGRLDSWHDDVDEAGEWLTAHRELAHGGTD